MVHVGGCYGGGGAVIDDTGLFVEELRQVYFEHLCRRRLCHFVSFVVSSFIHMSRALIAYRLKSNRREYFGEFYITVGKFM